MNALEKQLIGRISKSGPISIADYMAECLLHPEHGYYATRDPLGVDGDFTTAPEISQMFGEMLGLCLAKAWMDQGAPSPFALAELGPGRGTLMADILRATKGVPGFHAAAKLHLVEASPVLRTRQIERLAPHTVTHHDSIGSLPDAPVFLVANEFFDALPIRQYQRDGDGWRECQVGLGDDALTMGLTAPLPVPTLADRLADTQDGDVVEICAPAQGVMSKLASFIDTHGGAALIIDYGDWRSIGDTFQALKNHTPVSVLDTPGQADLTAHVDFEALARAAAPLTAHQMTPQGVFLERLGITARAQALADRLSGDALNSHITAHRRLTHPDEMGTLFKVLGLTRADSPDLPGLHRNQ
ncbi:SAM-dependent methyltransferase, MidA family [Aliiroseovarius halocynthiae]|uniref:Class I SAM-dependent methyltransferase n=1 Tax=Aliiroseovarius halocynthiae TaxID=985055 RepID=A0A545SM45_9RHOB|nr:SAM-dependent methyltransferase [Aliiroseovarius halocynthiae]TQV66045.1 class I SAM-dependent methyltransferase [Aliiroseovarius halocynthiae]SMR83247.1 SAM-dependent methyltransferase, MidA family [Aliiroseovarius halocynthiae]